MKTASLRRVRIHHRGAQEPALLQASARAVDSELNLRLSTNLNGRRMGWLYKRYLCEASNRTECAEGKVKSALNLLRQGERAAMNLLGMTSHKVVPDRLVGTSSGGCVERVG